MQLDLPSFSLKFPSFRLGKSWLTTLYGSGNPSLAPVPRGQLAVHSHPSLHNLEVALSAAGEVEFASGSEWKVKLVPENFSILRPTLLSGTGLQLLRGEDGETGLSFDEKSTRHFFVFGKTPAPKLLLKLEVLYCLSRLSVFLLLLYVATRRIYKARIQPRKRIRRLL